MTAQEAVDYINQHTWSQWKLGLSRTRELLRLLGDPQKRLRFVHVAGSNGKGSTCAMIERILREAGYVTGFYPSPYIEDFRERIQVCGEYIPEEALVRITERVRILADGMEDHPTQFELITAIGMVWFAEQNCDLVVLEVGLGGIYDATNVIDAPEVAVITNIGLEHTEYLGSTLAEIAGNKCGIIKTGSEVVCYQNAPEVMEVVRRTCEEKGCPLRIARFERILPLSQSLDGQVFRFLPDSDTEGEESLPAPSPCRGEQTCDAACGDPEPSRGRTSGAENSASAFCFTLALSGEYQLHNAATALTVIEALRGRGFRIPWEAVHRGLAEVTWPARFELLSRDPVFLLDGGHNPQCAGALAESIRCCLPGKKIQFLMGVLADKDYGAVIDILSPFAGGFVCLTPDSPRALPAEELAGFLTARGLEAVACKTPEEGIRTALEKAAGSGEQVPVIAFGSLYMAGAVRHAFPRVLESWLRQRPVPQDRNRGDCGGMEKTPDRSGPVREKGGTEKTPDRGRPVREKGGTEKTPDRSGPARENDGIQARKKAQREEAMKKRRALTPEERARKSESICRQLLRLPQLECARTVFAYAAAWDEADPGACCRALQEAGRTICYPVCETHGSRMTAVVPGEGPDAWRTGVFGIREPLPEKASVIAPAEIDAVIVPCVVFDRKGGRCGHGAGYYDRFLAMLSPRIPKILIAFDVQETEETAMDCHDIPMDVIVTESGIRYRSC